MDTRYPENADPRPKRRKDKDNPYTIYTIGADTESPKYFVEFDDGEGQHHCIELTAELFADFDGNELQDVSYMNEADRHYGEVISEPATDDITTETVLRHLEGELLQMSLDQLSELQRRRVVLRFFEEYTYDRIADMEGCTKMPVKRSIQEALKKIKTFLQNRGYFSASSEV